MSSLQSAGAIIVPTNETVYNATAIARMDVQTSDYREFMDAYLQDPFHGGTHPSTVAELYSNGRLVVLLSEYNYVKTSLTSSTSNSSYAPTKLTIQNLTTVLKQRLLPTSWTRSSTQSRKILRSKSDLPLNSGAMGYLWP